METAGDDAQDIHTPFYSKLRRLKYKKDLVMQKRRMLRSEDMRSPGAKTCPCQVVSTMRAICNDDLQESIASCTQGH